VTHHRIRRYLRAFILRRLFDLLISVMFTQADEKSVSAAGDLTPASGDHAHPVISLKSKTMYAFCRVSGFIFSYFAFSIVFQQHHISLLA